MTAADAAPSSGYYCSICHEDNLLEVGELDCCDHCFCVRCILKWAEVSNTCPLCKQRFWTVKHIRLDLSRLPVEPSDTLTAKFPGEVLQTHRVESRNQVPSPEDAVFEDPLEHLVCMECAGVQDEDLILLCDGCNQGCHTYCARPPLDGVPAGAWYCAVCAPTLASHPRRQAPRSRGQRAASPDVGTRATQRAPEALSREQRRRRRNRLRSAAIDDAAESEDEASDEDYHRRLDATVEELARSISRRVGQRQTTGGMPAVLASQTARHARPQQPSGQSDRARVPAHPSRAARTASGVRRTRALVRHAAEAAQSSQGLAELPTLGHRTVQSLRDNWQAIRRGEVEFGEQRRGREQPPSARRDNSDSEEDNVPLAVRFAQARAKRALQQERQHREQRAGSRRSGHPAATLAGRNISRSSVGRAQWSAAAQFRAELARLQEQREQRALTHGPAHGVVQFDQRDASGVAAAGSSPASERRGRQLSATKADSDRSPSRSPSAEPLLARLKRLKSSTGQASSSVSGGPHVSGASNHVTHGSHESQRIDLTHRLASEDSSADEQEPTTQPTAEQQRANDGQPAGPAKQLPLSVPPQQPLTVASELPGIPSSPHTQACSRDGVQDGWQASKRPTGCPNGAASSEEPQPQRQHLLDSGVSLHAPGTNRSPWNTVQPSASLASRAGRSLHPPEQGAQAAAHQPAALAPGSNEQCAASNSGESSPATFETGERQAQQAAAGLQASQPGSGDAAEQLRTRKHAAGHAVKQLLTPLFRQGKLISEDFKAVAKLATHRLYKSSVALESDAWQAEAAHAVRTAMRQEIAGFDSNLI